MYNPFNSGVKKDGDENEEDSLNDFYGSKEDTFSDDNNVNEKEAEENSFLKEEES